MRSQRLTWTSVICGTSRIGLALVVMLGAWPQVPAQAAPAAAVVPGEGYPHPILSDVRVRQAVAYCADREALVGSVYSFLTSAQQQDLLMDSIIPTSHWAHATPASTYAHNPTLGRQLLDQAGWTLGPGAQVRTNGAGQPLRISVTTTTSSFRVTYLTVLQTQLAACGVDLNLITTPASWFFGATTGLRVREFESSVFAWVSEPDPKGTTLYACDMIPTPANQWSGQNYMGWCNDTADAALLQATQVLTRSTRLAAYAVVQEAMATDMVSLPLFRRVELHGTDRNLSGFAPSPYSTTYTWNANTWSIPATTTLVIGAMQEPGSLFAMQDTSAIGGQVRALVEGVGAAVLPNGDLQPVLDAALPTVENGGIVVQEVPVTAGTLVADEGGTVQPLTAGMTIRTHSGAVVTYSGGTVMMSRAVITTSFQSGLMWSNGTPLVQADLALWDAIQCNPASSARTFNCADVTQREYLSATTARYTLVPGLVPQDVAPYLPGAYPSQRVVSGGRLLQNVPASEWPTLTEVTRTPIGLGPYRLVSWEPGVRMVFAANTFYGPGAPATPNLEIRFFQGSNILMANLISGVVDVAGAETGVAAQDLVAADQAGLVRAVVVASPTWEHLDFNLTEFYRLRLPSLQR